MRRFVKVVNPGKVVVDGRLREAFFRIEFAMDGVLTIYGVVGPRSGGRCAGSVGQCVEELGRISVYHAGWSRQAALKLRGVWLVWHLNDMRPGCAHQEHWDTERVLTLSDGLGRSAGHTRPEEHPEGLLTKPCPVCGYRYGTAWRKVDVPDDVLDWLSALPDTKITPAWV
jgi:hypothetical protein